MSIKIDTLAQDSLLQDLDTSDTAAVVGGGGFVGRREKRKSYRFLGR